MFQAVPIYLFQNGHVISLSIYIYIYEYNIIYISVCLSVLSLSLSLYIYIYIYSNKEVLHIPLFNWSLTIRTQETMCSCFVKYILTQTQTHARSHARLKLNVWRLSDEIKSIMIFYNDNLTRFEFSSNWIYIYIYIYIWDWEREREREKSGTKLKDDYLGEQNDLFFHLLSPFEIIFHMK